ncbi:MAG: efflux transporter outer membrane subunit [Burkholderiaceae bacterium]
MLFSVAGELATARNMLGVAPKAPWICSGSALRSASLDLQAQSTRARQSGDAGAPTHAGLTASNHRASLVAQYDLDLWGRLASSNGAAQQRLLAQEWSRAAVEWSLTAQLADAHFSLRAVHRQMQISDSVRTSRAQTLALRKQELAAGSASEFDTRRAEGERAGTDATLVSLQRQRVALEGTLDLLSGRNVAELAGPPVSVVALDTAREREPRLPQGEAAEFLARRPDLREAEAQLAASRADIGAARAATLPALSLSGNLGSDVRSLRNLFSASGFVWSIVASLSQSLLDGGANRARIDQAEAQTDAALARYRKAVLAAMLELREAYAALDLADQAQRAQSQRVVALEHSRQLAQIGVEAGVLAPLELLDAERNAFQAQLDEVAAYRDRLIGQVAVMKVLGGGHAGVSTPKTSGES